MQYRILSSLVVYTDSIITSHPRFPTAPGPGWALLRSRVSVHRTGNSEVRTCQATTPFVCIFHDPSGSKSSPATFAFITQFEGIMKRKMMKALHRCSVKNCYLEQFTPFRPWMLRPYCLLLRERAIESLGAAVFALGSFDSPELKAVQNENLTTWDFLMWFLPLTQLLLRVLKSSSPYKNIRFLNDSSPPRPWYSIQV